MRKPIISDELYVARSEEVQEILGKPPTFLMRWGIPTLFIFFVGTLVLAHFIRYPDTIVAHALLTSNPPPVRLMSKATGYLRLLVCEGEEVQAGKPLAYIQNPAHVEEITALEKQLALFKPTTFQENTQTLRHLGELQTYYDALISACSEWQIREKYPTQIASQQSLAQQLQREKIKTDNVLSQDALNKEAFSQVYKNYQMDSLLYRQKVKTPLEFNQAQAELLRQKQTLKNSEATILNQNTQIANIQEKLTEMRLQANEQEAKLWLTIENAYRNLTTQLNLWKHRYVVIAPVAGKVHFLQYWADNQYITAEQELMTLLSPTKATLVQLRIPAQGAGKVQTGQMIWLELADFPAQEFGKMKGNIMHIAPSIQIDKSKDNTAQYIAFAELASLQTDYGKTIALKPEMQGQVHIITSPYSLLQRMLLPLYKALQGK
jgi:multidrug efflux pump subunit AcrA (membrane-fusion protein)